MKQIGKPETCGCQRSLVPVIWSFWHTAFEKVMRSTSKPPQKEERAKLSRAKGKIKYINIGFERNKFLEEEGDQALHRIHILRMNDNLRGPRL